MHESVTYQAILAEGEAKGREEEAKRVVEWLGTKRFGPPDGRVRAALDALSELDRIERMTRRLLDVASWDELLSTP